MYKGAAVSDLPVDAPCRILFKKEVGDYLVYSCVRGVVERVEKAPQGAECPYSVDVKVTEEAPETKAFLDFVGQEGATFWVFSNTQEVELLLTVLVGESIGALRMAQTLNVAEQNRDARVKFISVVTGASTQRG
ncbi:hypothetical protein CO180_04090 [candidate division WWE3 bacterium CG_4_9_14_3_um_filter_41_6]|uniref:Uncharacterized protein n=1 Tax=candidate division WWE3 bacterium CG_4_10_14_0_2_um_filter_41_14 TaxID=1975072 RepID=A0A2M7TKT4_UNCKA|nr:MAG: hypothetical protein COY32_01545 [candidate division WWE3 bacterium CG_4_10_14_0_2_um_filter_41_14]PJA38208.1 MAG: hypothetical protein CO180_04090 [candidate division WWE3 bacterium CG_4_9_14_3_um_filter_41_6]